MIKNQIFDLKKVKDLIFPIEKLQYGVKYLNQILNEFKKNKEKVNQNLFDENVINQLEELNSVLEGLSKNLTKFILIKDLLMNIPPNEVFMT